MDRSSRPGRGRRVARQPPGGHRCITARRSTWLHLGVWGACAWLLGPGTVAAGARPRPAQDARHGRIQAGGESGCRPREYAAAASLDGILARELGAPAPTFVLVEGAPDVHLPALHVSIKRRVERLELGPVLDEEALGQRRHAVSDEVVDAALGRHGQRVLVVSRMASGAVRVRHEFDRDAVRVRQSFIIAPQSFERASDPTGPGPAPAKLVEPRFEESNECTVLEGGDPDPSPSLGEGTRERDTKLQRRKRSTRAVMLGSAASLAVLAGAGAGVSIHNAGQRAPAGSSSADATNSANHFVFVSTSGALLGSAIAIAIAMGDRKTSDAKRGGAAARAAAAQHKTRRAPRAGVELGNAPAGTVWGAGVRANF